MINFLKNREAKNAGWLIAGRIGQMIVSFFVGIITARYLGPNNYGLVNYATAYVAFFTSLCTLGLNSVIVKEFIDNPNEEGETIGTTLLLKFVSSILSVVTIVSFVSVVDYGEPTTIMVVTLSSLSLVFHIFETLNYWFQYKYLSKVSAICGFIAYFVAASYKIVLLVLQKDVRWFAFSTSIDFIIMACLLWISYKKYGGESLSFSFEKAKKMLSRSYHYILSGTMIAIYGQMDKLMLKQMLNEIEVGFYSTATAICAMWTFVLQAIIDSMYPTILQLYKSNKYEFNRKNKQLYAIVFYISAIVSIVFVTFGNYIIRILYGEDYMGAVRALRVVTWYTAFSYLGVARNAWIVCENKQKYLKYMYFAAVIINIGLNYLLIPVLGATGAAIASLITQVFTSLLLPLFFKGMKQNSKMMIEAIFLKGIFNK